MLGLFSLGAIIALLIQGLLLVMMVLSLYALILIIKALQIYIRKNGGA